MTIKRTPWSLEDIEKLHEVYSTWPPQYQLLEPGRTRQSIQAAASGLGLTHGANQQASFDNISVADWAYLAAFIDGEGTIGLRPEGVKNWHKVFVGVFNTHEPTMRWVMETFPGGSWYAQEKASVLSTKPIYRVRWQRRVVLIELLTHLIPYMRIKKEKALEALTALQ